jgi:hypothetical protein
MAKWYAVRLPLAIFTMATIRIAKQVTSCWSPRPSGALVKLLTQSYLFSSETRWLMSFVILPRSQRSTGFLAVVLIMERNKQMRQTSAIEATTTKDHMTPMPAMSGSGCTVGQSQLRL